VLDPCRRTLLDANLLATAAGVYWLELFPHVRGEAARWRRHAEQIGDSRLAALAVDTQVRELGNLEGSAVFALLAPRARRREVLRASVAFQALYDFLDTLAELPVPDPHANGRRLHLALLACLDVERPLLPYLEHSGFAREQCGYVEELIGACRRALGALPSYAAVAPFARLAAARMVAYQSLSHGPPGAERRALRRWALALTPPGSGLLWWEAAAGAASSLGVFALLAAAADGSLGERGARALADAYFPWTGALHVLLDSLVDREVDLRSGEHSLVEHYAEPDAVARRLALIAAESRARLQALPQGSRHALILTAMSCFYLARPAARAEFAAPAADRVQAALGRGARPAMAMLRAHTALSGAS